MSRTDVDFSFRKSVPAYWFLKWGVLLLLWTLALPGPLPAQLPKISPGSAQNQDRQSREEPNSRDSTTTEQGRWTSFLGNQRNGISDETGLNVNWNKHKPSVLWREPLGGGYSSIVIADGKLWTMATHLNHDYIICLDALSGKKLWSTRGAPTYLDNQRQARGPRSTPTWHAGKLYCLLPAGDLLCLTADTGRILWKVNIFDISGAPRQEQKTIYYWGMSASPLIEGDLVILQPGGSANNSVIAVHKDTGKLVWSAGTDPPGYASPIVIEAENQRQIIVPTGQSILSLNPIEGSLLWRVVWGNKYNCNCATPVWNEDSLFISSAYGTGSMRFALTLQNEELRPISRWKNLSMQNQFATSIIKDGYIYGPHGDLATVTYRCLDMQRGEVQWKSRRVGKCTQIAAQGHLICLTEQGTLVLIEANSTEYREKGKLTGLLEFKAWAHPALANHRLYLRDEKRILCLDLQEK
ncbi:PQQ-binding-like beta-propeller repeat protein [Gimesia chilikensis]|uniref:outer membrane protein assembly factor BamB family protein n=1 Tax=Gimesia chilikensis TaxID=2605989 RepID=UPI00118D3DA8|nr:PQQ-binding-like beta-propeller repeat protein [Gimesia chilikensis]QDT85034.1 outer membrane biogenesis protein BamB [Gimesia chilikensis]